MLGYVLDETFVANFKKGFLGLTPRTLSIGPSSANWIKFMGIIKKRPFQEVKWRSKVSPNKASNLYQKIQEISRKNSECPEFSETLDNKLQVV